MPEGDAVLRAAQRLHRALAGRPLAAAELRWGALIDVDLTGRHTLEVVSRGKHLLHRLEGGTTVHSHLRMDGRWRVQPTPQVRRNALRSPELRAVLTTTQQTSLGWQLGILDVVDTAAEDSLIGHLGPDVLGSDWDEQVAFANLRADPEAAVGTGLLDQRNLAGLGTIYTSEPLFMERVLPWRPIGDLDDATLLRVVRRAYRVLHAGAARGRPMTTGDPREPVYVFGRSGRPCRRCGETVRIARIGAAPQDRVLCYCPRCQGGVAPTDDGRRQRPLGAR